MRVALVDVAGSKNIYPMGLLRLGAWHKARGDTCTLFRGKLPDMPDPVAAFDDVMISATFTFDIPRAIAMGQRAQELWGESHVLVGGVAPTLMPDLFRGAGLRVHVGLVQQAEDLPLDYGLLGRVPEYSIVRTSRGCVRSCKFCAVRALEPSFMDRPGWARDLHPRARRAVFFDNNFTAKRPAHMRRDLGILRDQVASGAIKSIDFNQGLDCRLITEEIADLFAGLPVDPVRFAYDGLQEAGHIETAIGKMYARGFRNFRVYTLYNYRGGPEDFYHRVRVLVELQEELSGSRIEAYPMRYAPIYTLDPGRRFAGPAWSMAEAKAVNVIVKHHGPYGVLAFNTLAEFVYWFGDDGAAFRKLINYPKLVMLMRRRKAAVAAERRAG
jgi:hypothetical protein